MLRRNRRQQTCRRDRQIGAADKRPRLKCVVCVRLHDSGTRDRHDPRLRPAAPHVRDQRGVVPLSGGQQPGEPDADQRCEIGACHLRGLFDSPVLGRQLFERDTFPCFRKLLLDLRSRFDGRRAFVARDCFVQLASRQQNVSDLYERSRVRRIEIGSLA